MIVHFLFLWVRDWWLCITGRILDIDQPFDFSKASHRLGIYALLQKCRNQDENLDEKMVEALHRLERIVEAHDNKDAF